MGDWTVRVLVLERPYPLMVAALAVGLGVGWWASRRGRGGAGVGWILGGLAVAASVWTAARVVTTEREVVSGLTRDLVEAVARVDGGALRGLLGEEVAVTAPVGPGLEGREEVIAAVERYLGAEYPVRWAKVTGLDVDVRGVVAVAVVRVSVMDDRYGSVTRSVWEVRWSRIGGAWRAAGVAVVEFPGLVRTQRSSGIATRPLL